jgi:hypothetical protein
VPLSTTVVPGVRLIIHVSVSHRSLISVVVSSLTVAPIIWSTCPNAALLRTHPTAIKRMDFNCIALLNAEGYCGCKIFLLSLVGRNSLYQRCALPAMAK